MAQFVLRHSQSTRKKIYVKEWGWSWGFTISVVEFFSDASKQSDEFTHETEAHSKTVLMWKQNGWRSHSPGVIFLFFIQMCDLKEKKVESVHESHLRQWFTGSSLCLSHILFHFSRSMTVWMQEIKALPFIQHMPMCNKVCTFHFLKIFVKVLSLLSWNTMKYSLVALTPSRSTKRFVEKKINKHTEYKTRYQWSELYSSGANNCHYMNDIMAV